jgi:hypothetical protein
MPKNASSTYLAGRLKKWDTYTIYSSTVTGPGPFLIAIHGFDYGFIGGIRAIILIDGETYTVTGSPDSKFVLQPVRNASEAASIPSDWLSNASFDDSTWVRARKDSKLGRVALEDKMALRAGVAYVRMVWAPSVYATKIENYARVVITPPSCSKDFSFKLMIKSSVVFNQIVSIAATLTVKATSSPTNTFSKTPVTVTSAAKPNPTYLISETSPVTTTTISTSRPSSIYCGGAHNITILINVDDEYKR